MTERPVRPQPDDTGHHLSDEVWRRVEEERARRMATREALARQEVSE